MRTASRFLKRIGASFALAVMAACLTNMVSAESVRLGTLVTEVYPEIVARSFLPECPEPVSVDRKALERSAESESGGKVLRTANYAEVLSRQFVTELDRRKYDLSDIEVQGLVREINPWSRSPGDVLLHDRVGHNLTGRPAVC